MGFCLNCSKSKLTQNNLDICVFRLSIIWNCYPWVAASLLNKQSRIADKGCASSSGVGRRANSSSRYAFGITWTLGLHSTRWSRNVCDNRNVRGVLAREPTRAPRDVSRVTEEWIRVIEFMSSRDVRIVCPRPYSSPCWRLKGVWMEQRYRSTHS
jgi:hypothetical protein